MKKSVGLALGGGAVLGAAHVGVLRALHEYGYQFTHISGTSVGSLIGALVAFGKDWKQIEEIALNLSWLQAARLRFSKLGLLSNERLGKSIREMIGDVAFDEAEIPLYMIATDIGNGDRVVLSSGDVAEAIMASTCIPGIFEPVEIDGRLLVDGGICENIPVQVLADAGVSPIMAVDLMSRHAHRRPKNIIEVLINSFAFTLSSSVKQVLDRKDVWIISPELSDYNTVETKQIPELIERGYQDALRQLEAWELKAGHSAT